MSIKNESIQDEAIRLAKQAKAAARQLAPISSGEKNRALHLMADQLEAKNDYLVEENNRLVQLFGESDSIALDTYFVYPEELKTVARVQVFRDFVVSKAQRWPS